jgi:hypothetical protein
MELIFGFLISLLFSHSILNQMTSIYCRLGLIFIDISRVDDTDFLDFSESFERKALNEEQVKLLELGQKDRATPVEVSVTIHITESFR